MKEAGVGTVTLTVVPLQRAKGVGTKAKETRGEEAPGAEQRMSEMVTEGPGEEAEMTEEGLIVAHATIETDTVIEGPREMIVRASEIEGPHGTTAGATEVLEMNNKTSLDPGEAGTKGPQGMMVAGGAGEVRRENLKEDGEEGNRMVAGDGVLEEEIQKSEEVVSPRVDGPEVGSPKAAEVGSRRGDGREVETPKAEEVASQRVDGPEEVTPKAGGEASPKADGQEEASRKEEVDGDLVVIQRVDDGAHEVVTMEAVQRVEVDGHQDELECLATSDWMTRIQRIDLPVTIGQKVSML